MNDLNLGASKEKGLKFKKYTKNLLYKKVVKSKSMVLFDKSMTYYKWIMIKIFLIVF